MSSCKNGTNDDWRESLSVTDVKPIRKLLQILMPGLSTSITVRTIQRNIIDMGFRSRRPTRVPCTTQSFTPHLGPSHRHWTVDNWKHVARSDESRFQLNRAVGCVRDWRQPHESMDLTCPQGTLLSGGGSVIVWGVCNWHDMGHLISLTTTMTGDRYVNILSDLLHPFKPIVHSTDSAGLEEFQQDNETAPHIQNLYRVAPGALF
ncbi:transposable element Tcb2 transposase [Trichonephila clavipes]|nr:transposable element Tcb2 transposase [Trichonephila clavipes]